MPHALKAVGNIHTHDKYTHRLKRTVYQVTDHVDPAVTLQKTDVCIKGLGIFFHCLMVFLPIGVNLMIGPAGACIVHLAVQLFRIIQIPEYGAGKAFILGILGVQISAHPAAEPVIFIMIVHKSLVYGAQFPLIGGVSGVLYGLVQPLHACLHIKVHLVRHIIHPVT